MASNESGTPDLKGLRLWIARIGWLLSFALAVLAFWASSRSRMDQLLDISLPLQLVLMSKSLTYDFLRTYITAWDTTIFIAFAVVSLVIFFGKSNRWLAIYASAMLLQLSVASTRPGDALVFLEPKWQIWLLLSIALGNSMVGLFPYVFPEDCKNPKRLIPLAMFSGAWPFVWYLTPALTSTRIPWPPASPPFLVTLLWVAAAISVELYRFGKCSTLPKRLQARWIVTGLVIAAAGYLGFLFFTPLLIPSVMEPSVARLYYVVIGVPGLYVTISAIPLSLAISVLKYRLWDVNLVLNRTIVYVTLTGLLAGLYAAIIKAIQTAFVALTGNESDAAILMTTLILFAVFTPAKNTLQEFVDRNFKDRAEPADALKDFDLQVQSILRIMDPRKLAFELLDRAATSLSARSGALLLQGEGGFEIVHKFGSWDGVEALSVPIEMGERILGKIMLGPSLDHSGYKEEDRRALESCASRVAQALSIAGAPPR